jgi:DNA-binding NtrC family response regulator
MVQALVIEDERALRILYGRILEQADFSVDTAENGTIAIEHLSEFVPELILLDIRMPNSSGLDVILHLQEHQGLNHTYVVIISASQEYERYAKMLPSAEFLQKPVLSPQLLEIAERVKKQASME